MSVLNEKQEEELMWNELRESIENITKWPVVSACGVSVGRMAVIGDAVCNYLMQPIIDPALDTESEQEFNERMSMHHFQFMQSFSTPKEEFIAGFMVGTLSEKIYK